MKGAMCIKGFVLHNLAALFLPATRHGIVVASTCWEGQGMECHNLALQARIKSVSVEQADRALDNVLRR